MAAVVWRIGRQLPQPSISKGADFHFIPEQRAWRINRSTIIILCNNHKHSNTCIYTERAQEETKAQCDQTSKFNSRPFHSAWYPSPWSFAPSEKSRWLSSESLRDDKWRGRRQQSKRAKQKLWLPSGTAPFLHLLELECHSCMVKPSLSSMERGGGTYNTHKQMWANILPHAALACRQWYSKD